MKKAFIAIFFSSLTLISFAQSKDSHSKLVSKIENGEDRFKGILQLSACRNSERKNCLVGGWKKIEIVTNSGDITEVKINDTLTIGVEISAHSLVWKKDKLPVLDAHFYSKKDGKWELYEDEGEFVSTLRVGKALPFRGWTYVSGKEFLRLDFSIKLED